MANQIHTYKDRDIKRVIKAVRSMGLHLTGVEVDPKSGRIKVLTADIENESGGNPWDAEVEKMSAT